jgi:hypothetical protein
MKKIDMIKQLVAQGILGPEQLPEPDYWSWPVLKPEELPYGFDFSYDFLCYGEVRWYGGGTA